MESREDRGRRSRAHAHWIRDRIPGDAGRSQSSGTGSSIRKPDTAIDLRGKSGEAKKVSPCYLYL